MIIAVCAKDKGLESLVDERFGRAENYVIINTETDEVRTVDNTAKLESAGAGGSAVRLISNEGAEAILAPELGPKAMDAVKAFELKVYRYTEIKTVKETLDDYKAGKLKETSQSTINSKHGLHRA